MKRNIPTEQELIGAGYTFWRQVDRWKVFRRVDANTGPGMPAHTEYMAIVEDDFYTYTTQGIGGSTPKGPAWRLKQWLTDLEGGD